MLQERMELELIQILDFLFPGRLSLDDNLSRRVPVDQSFIHRIQDGSFQLMVKIHGCLAFMVPCIIIDQLLINDPCQVLHLQFGKQPVHPGLCHLVFRQRHRTDGSVFVYGHPVRVVFPKQLFSAFTFLHKRTPFVLLRW